MSIIDASSGYHNLKLDEKSSYLSTFACPFGWYHYKQLPFRAAPAGDMYQCKIYKIFSDMPNIYDENGTDHDTAEHKVLHRCEEVNLKLNKEKCHFRCTYIPSLGR